MMEAREKQKWSWELSLALLLLIPVLLLTIHVIQDIWSWYLQPRFGPVSNLTIAGIILLSSLLRRTTSLELTWAVIARSFLIPLFVWGLAALFRFFVKFA